MASSLLERQTQLLEHLTSGATIFGAASNGPPGQALHGINPGLLRLEAALSHEKRAGKVAAIFPRAFELLGAECQALLRLFAAAHPPTDIGFIENARQFHSFLCAHRLRAPLRPPYVHEVAACELALAMVYATAHRRSKSLAESVGFPGGRIRRDPSVILLRCAFDVSTVLIADGKTASPQERDTPLAVAMPPGARQPRIFELAPEIFSLLGAMTDWSDAALFTLSSGQSDIIGGLAQYGLVEESD